jgi:Ni,Fe-hydrogenase maturation factor
MIGERYFLNVDTKEKYGTVTCFITTKTNVIYYSSVQLKQLSNNSLLSLPSEKSILNMVKKLLEPIRLNHGIEFSDEVYKFVALDLEELLVDILKELSKIY